MRSKVCTYCGILKTIDAFGKTLNAKMGKTMCVYLALEQEV